MLLKLFRWFCGGLLLLLGGLVGAKASLVGGGLFLLAGLLVLPPTFPLLARTANIFLSRPLKWLAVVVACVGGIGAFATDLETNNQPQPTAQALAAERLARHVEDSLGIQDVPTAPADPRVPYRTYSGRKRRTYYSGRTYREYPTQQQSAAPAATGLSSSPRTYTYRTSSTPASGSAPAASQPYSAPRVFSYRPGRPPATAPPSRPQPYQPTRYSWRRTSKQ